MSELCVLTVFTFFPVDVYSVQAVNTALNDFILPAPPERKSKVTRQNYWEKSAGTTRETGKGSDEGIYDGRALGRRPKVRTLQAGNGSRTILPFGFELIVALMGKAFVIALISVLLTATTGMKSIYDIFAYPDRQAAEVKPFGLHSPYREDRPSFDLESDRPSFDLESDPPSFDVESDRPSSPYSPAHDEIQWIEV